MTGAVPPPPEDLARRELPTEPLRNNTFLYRIARVDRDALYYGPPRGPNGRRTPEFRFDDPRGEYGVCYLGCTPEAAFCETFLRDPAVRTISRKQADARKIATVELGRPLILVALHGPGLAQLGATAAVADGPYEAAQAWSRALHELDQPIDGLIYRARHDNSQFAVALYDDRVGGPHDDALRVVAERGVRDDRAWFGGVLDRYGRGLDED